MEKINDNNILGIIGGSSLLESSYFANLEKRIIDTDFGPTILHFGDNFVFCQRHHADPTKEYTPPHLINHEAIASAMKKVGVDKVISFGSVGALKRSIALGTLVFPDDFFNLWNQRSLFSDARSHIVPAIDPELRQELITAIRNGLADSQVPIHEGGTYVQTPGPRFETKAEIRVIALYGDVVAMTAAHEIPLYCELGIKIALVNMVDNMANGISEETLSFAQFKEGVRKNEKIVEKVLGIVLTHFIKK